MAIGSLFSRKGSVEAVPQEGRSTFEPPVKAREQSVATRLKLLENFEQSGLGWFWATDAKGRLTYISDSAADTIGVTAAELREVAITDLLVVDDEEEGDRPSRPLPFLMSARNRFIDLPVRIDAGGRMHWWSIAGKPNLAANGSFQGYFGSAKDISNSRQQQIDAARLAQYDSLTGLANRHRFTSRLIATLNSQKVQQRSSALMMLDLDRFKQVNDTLGHPAGDELLKQVGQRLKKMVDSKAEIGRLGGDEFQIILPDMDDRGELGQLADRIIQMVSQPYSIDGSRAIIGTSIGIAIAPYDGVDQEDLARSVDLALYAAKGGGRGQFRFYSSDLKDGVNRRREIEEDLRDAIQTEELQLHYQPIVHLGEKRVSCFEALMRWNNPKRGPVSPAEFIPIAEETGLINELGLWALRRACTDATEWSGNVRVAVNVSAIQFADVDFPDRVQEVLDATGLEPSRLELEITESVFLGDPRTTQRMFKDLKTIGVRLALDDFGTGYSSLSYLRNAPFDKIKIDQSFVHGATEAGNNNAALITAIVSLAGALNMETVAEGVDAMDALALVTDLGASHVQGFIFSKALPQSEVLPRLNDGRLEFEPVGPARYRSERKSVYRIVNVIHEDHCYEVVLRNLSKSGAAIEGMLNVPKGTGLVLDLGGGQLAVSTVKRSEEYAQGLAFEAPLVNDGTDGLCTRHRVSPYSLAAAGMPLEKLPEGNYQAMSQVDDGPKTRPAFLQVDMSKRKSA